ncbi:MAG TPA: MFS transporter [Candidatus Limnocylindria bacterium]|nr:MFS transporter [Candidatus Limnocylindria bacterium]
MTATRSSAGALGGANFSVFWLAQTISRFGDPITLIALAAATYRLTASAFLTSVAVLVATLPQATVGFIGGAVADALGLRRAMVLCDVARAVLIAAIPLTFAFGLPLAVAFLLVFLAAVCASVFNPARVAIVPALVPAPRLAASNSLVYATDRTVEIIGALAAGALVATFGDGAFYVDALTFLLSAVLLARVQVVEPAPRRVSVGRVWADALDGLGFIRRNAPLYANTVISLVAQLSIPVFNGLLPVLIFRRFAGGDAMLGARDFGIAEAALAAGAVLMGVAYARISARPKGRLLIAGWAAYGALLMLVAAAPSLPVLIGVLVLAGVANVLFYVPNVTISQQITPPELRGRVFGARISLLSLSWLPVVIVSGALADVIPAEALIGAAGAFTLLVALVALRIPIVRDIA